MASVAEDAQQARVLAVFVCAGILWTSLDFFGMCLGYSGIIMDYPSFLIGWPAPKISENIMAELTPL